MAEQRAQSWVRDLTISIVGGVVVALIVSRLGLDKNDGSNNVPEHRPPSLSTPSSLDDWLQQELARSAWQSQLTDAWLQQELARSAKRHQFLSAWLWARAGAGLFTTLLLFAWLRQQLK